MYVCMYVCVHTLSEHAYTYSYESRLQNNWQISSDMYFVCPDFTFRHQCISQAGAVSSAPRIMPSGRTLGAMAPRAMVCVRAYAPQVGPSAVSSSYTPRRCRRSRLQRLSVTNFGCPFEARLEEEQSGWTDALSVLRHCFDSAMRGRLRFQSDPSGCPFGCQRPVCFQRPLARV